MEFTQKYLNWVADDIEVQLSKSHEGASFYKWFLRTEHGTCRIVIPFEHNSNRHEFSMQLMDDE